MSYLFNMPLIEYVYRRCRKSSIKRIIVATSDDSSDEVLYNYCKSHDIPAMRGSLDNVLQRYIQAAGILGAEYIIRVCGDTPFVDIFLMDKLLQLLVCERLDYATFNRETCAPCFYSEAIAMQALRKVAGLTAAKDDMEHVSKFIIENKDKFLTRFIDVDLNPDSIRGIRLTIDYPEDIKRANVIVDELKDGFLFSSKEILDVVSKKELQQ